MRSLRAGLLLVRGPFVTPYYERNGITIYHGDCREVIPSLPTVDLVLTDPPYAAGAQRREWRVTASVAIGLDAAARRVRKGGAMLVFTTTSGRGIDFTLGCVGTVLPFNRLLIWHKRFVRSRVAGPWRWDAVSILAFGRASFGRPEHSSVFSTPAPASKRLLGDSGHPAELPPSVADWLYGPLATDETVVLDPFLGVGSLLEPAARLGRRAIGIEIEERYCEIAARRLSQDVLPLEVTA